MNFYEAIIIIKNYRYFCPDWCAQWVGHCSANQKVAGLIPGQAHAWVAGQVPG